MIEKIIMNRKQSFIAVTISYIIAFIIGYISFLYFKEMDMILRTFIADVVATLVIWILSHIFNNASLYDPYWSVAPIAIWLLWFSETKYKTVEKIYFSFVPNHGL